MPSTPSALATALFTVGLLAPFLLVVVCVVVTLFTRAES